MKGLTYDLTMILLAAFLVFANGFFVAAEFALVKVRRGRLNELEKSRRPFVSTARWLSDRLDDSLSACQLGITIASLGLGWIGEPAVAHLLRPPLLSLGITSEVVLHGFAFVIAFTIITGFHLVLGEQVPKIAAIRNPETALVLCAIPLKIFYFLVYPFLIALSATTAFLLRAVGIAGSSEEDVPHSEEEIRALIRQAHVHGKLSRSEHRLISAVFAFDDLICRRVMVPRIDVLFLDADSSLADTQRAVQETKHSRYPVCEGSMDKVVGVLHIKDLIGVGDAAFNLRTFMRPPLFVPETLPVRRLLRQFQSVHQHMAFLVDEYGTVTGMITLENVLEPIIGSVEDEFDHDSPEIVAEGPLQYVVSGSLPLEVIRQRFGLDLVEEDIDTLSGLLVSRMDRLLTPGDRVELPGAVAEVLDVKARRARLIRLTLSEPPPETP